MSIDLSRRAIVAGAASVPALVLPAVAVAAMEPINALAQLADQICAEYDRLGTLDRDIENADWKLFDSLNKQLWGTPATSIRDLGAKARVLDKQCRIDGKPHGTNARQWDLVDDLLALAVQS